VTGAGIECARPRKTLIAGLVTLLIFFGSPSKWPKTKIGKALFPTSKDYGKFKTDRLVQQEQLSPLVKHSNQNRI
jgi:hypothetical protein